MAEHVALLEAAWETVSLGLASAADRTGLACPEAQVKAGGLDVVEGPRDTCRGRVQSTYEVLI